MKDVNINASILNARLIMPGRIITLTGLQEALSRVDEYCTDSWLLKRKENKVAEKQRKVAKRQRELEQARASGKPRKIADKQKNLDEARDERAKARLELNR